MNCVFCRIMNNELSSYTVFEDKVIKVFMDINPSSNGHILIVPKHHNETVEDVDLETINHINVIIKKMYRHIKNRLNTDGITIVQNNGLGQDIKHYHVHMIPKYKANDIKDIKEIYDILK